MWAFMLKLFSDVGFMPHGHCFLWTPGVLWPYVISDTLIAGAYYSIPLSLWYVLKKRTDLPFSWLASLFAVFIFACGTTHLMGVIDIWNPLYRLDAAIKVITSVVSVLTAVLLYYKMPVLLAFPSRAAELERLNEELRRESLERLRAEQKATHLNATLEQRVTDRTRELELANHELAAFSYSVAHDMRAPLRAIGGFAEILKEDFKVDPSSDANRYLNLIRDAGTRMSMLIDSMLELSRVTRSTMQRQELDLSRLAREAIETLMLEQPRSGVTFTMQDKLIAHADPKFLRIVLENLLGNAWKYTSKTEAAVIEFGRIDHGPERETVWFVRDNGAGFNMEHASQLFGVFQRLHNDEEFPGNGVGLATVQRIVTKHGGRIWAEAALGRGATFFFTLGESNGAATRT
jgi:signal transduction histidine kinase